MGGGEGRSRVRGLRGEMGSYGGRVASLGRRGDRLRGVLRGLRLGGRSGSGLVDALSRRVSLLGGRVCRCGGQRRRVRRERQELRRLRGKLGE